MTLGAPTADGRRDAMSSRLAANWWAVLLRGILAVAFGLVSLLVPGVALGSLILLLAVYLLVDGALGVVAAVRAVQAHARWGWLAFEGVLSILAGLVALFRPGLAVLTLVLLLSVWAVISGVILLVAAFRLHMTHGRVLLGLAGAVSILWGALLYVAPVTGAYVLTLWIGAYALVFGAMLVLLGLRLRSRHAARAD